MPDIRKRDVSALTGIALPAGNTAFSLPARQNRSGPAIKYTAAARNNECYRQKNQKNRNCFKFIIRLLKNRKEAQKKSRSVLA